MGGAGDSPPNGFFSTVQDAQQDVIRQLAEQRDRVGGNAVIAINFQHYSETTALGAVTIIYAQGTVARLSSQGNPPEQIFPLAFS